MIGFQGVGALDIDSEVIPRLREATVGMSALAHFGSNKTPSTLDAIRAIRSELVLGRGIWQSREIVLNVPAPMLTALTDTHYPTAILLRNALGGHIWSFDRLTHVHTLSLQDYDRILSSCPDHADTITHGDAADHCIATLLHLAASNAESQSAYIHPEVWVALLKQTITFNLYNGDYEPASISQWPPPSLGTIEGKNSLKLYSMSSRTSLCGQYRRIWRCAGPTGIPSSHTAKSPIWRNTSARSFPIGWPEESEPASATVPSPAAQQDNNVASIFASETTSAVALAVSSAADPASPPTPSAAPAASNSEHSLHTVSILEPESVLISSVTPHIDSDDEPPTAADAADAIPGAEAPGSVISAPSASEPSKALDSDFDAFFSLSPQGPAHLGTDEDALDSSSSTGGHDADDGRDADVGHPESDEHAPDDREPASEPHQTPHGASSEIAVGDSGSAGATTPVTPKPDASVESLVAPRNIPIADDPSSESDLPHTTTNPKLPRSVTSDNEDS
ncbi:hypothetical protein EXIGLDRAFT_708812 [Exidia glandulosa HHB12029]|uniref:Uncharacterized protein n=1 Tax=Exidia glandulosa HHB12029 TaxID=1314781 RepID=A0A165J669_EXIGL|nr:hypothetical protein EXIGLDRAFT_708812 [Exidia glandulosa HHB12029]